MTKGERSWVLYDWANSAYAVIILTAVLPLFYKDVASGTLEGYLSTAYWGYANTIATIFIAIAAPVLGAFADYRGNKKRFMIFFLGTGLLFTSLLSLVGEGEWQKCLVFYVISVVGFRGANIFYDAFLVDVTDEKQMDWISASGYAWGYIGSVFPFLISMVIILKPASVGLQTTHEAVKVAFLITAGWWLIFSLPLIRNVKQVHYIPASSHPVRDSFTRLATTFKDIRQYRNIALFLLAYFCYIDGVDSIVMMAAVYGKDVGIGNNDLLTILFVIQIIAFPCALLYGKLAERFSAKVMLLIGIAGYMGITFYAYFLKTVWQYWILALLVAMFQGGIQALSRSFYGKMIPKDKAGEFFGFYNIFGKFAIITGPFLIGTITQLTHNTRYGVFSLVALFLAGGVLLVKVKIRGKVKERWG